MLATTLAVLMILLALAALAVTLSICVVCVNGVPLSGVPGTLTRLRHCLTSNCAQTSIDSTLPELRQRHWAMSPERLYDTVSLACRRLGWTVNRQSSDSLTVEARVSPGLFGIGEVVVITIESHRSGAAAHIRSTSTMGPIDFGANLQRIVELGDTVDRLANGDVFRSDWSTTPVLV